MNYFKATLIPEKNNQPRLFYWHMMNNYLKNLVSLFKKNS